MVPPMRVLHVIPWFYPATRYGGPPESVLRLCQGLLTAGVDVELMCTDADGPGKNFDVPRDRLVDHEGVPVRYFERFPKVSFSPSAGLLGYAARHLRGYDLIHSHTLFNFSATVVPLLARTLRVPYVVSPRGMCLPWGMSQHRGRKLPYWWLLERPNLRAAAAIHATGEREERVLRELAPGVPILTVPNAVQLRSAIGTVKRVANRVAFLGRLHRKKGFDVLIPAMSLLTKIIPDVELVIAGGDDDGEWRRIEGYLNACEPR
ncbi:glycosyltransferase, partial [Desulfobulbus sp. AH-315-M07]|nr:glycosyltransferase [Desulfobulbus sp. AH-315-M07]